MFYILQKMSPIYLFIFILIFQASCSPAPEQYTKQSDLMTGFEQQPYKMMYSPDMTCLAYIPTRQSSAIKFRSSLWTTT